jgi:hypothetical protein
MSPATAKLVSIPENTQSQTSTQEQMDFMQDALG